MSDIDTYSDTPKQAVDLLGMETRCIGIAEFIKTCDTPMTVAIQGDWGTGKTTAMRLISEYLKPSREGNGECQDICEVWFDTWQFSVLGSGTKLIINLMTLMLDELTKKAKEKLNPEEQASFESNSSHIKENLLKMAAFTGKLAGTIARQAFNASKAGIVCQSIAEVSNIQQKETEETSPDTAVDEVDLIITLKEKMNEQIRLITTGNNRCDRIYVFIDDLDRLEPIVAVELMEGIKNFLDCPGCVFVLAVDNEVVELGLQAKYGMAKYGMAFDAEKAKKFFDKIIQVPFQLPVNTYDITTYVSSFLKTRNEEDMAQRYADLLAGFDESNPRTIKRSFNLFRLQEKIEEASKRNAETGEISLRRYAMMLFKLENERAYEKVFVAIVKRGRTGNPNNPYNYESIKNELNETANRVSPISDYEFTNVDYNRINAVLNVFSLQETDNQYRNTAAFVTIIEETAPEQRTFSDEKETESNIKAAHIFKSYYELISSISGVTLSTSPEDFDPTIETEDEIANYLRIKEKLDINIQHNGRRALMIRVTNGSATANITFYTRSSAQTLFGAYLNSFCEIRNGVQNRSDGRYGYYDKTGEASRLTVIRAEAPDCGSNEAESLKNVILKFLNSQ